MRSRWLAFAAIPASLIAVPALAQGDNVLRGEQAFGGYTENMPGVQRLITPEDLPEPFATEPTAAVAQMIPRPDDAMPIAPDGFEVSLFASGLQTPRVIAIAPNDDVFVAETGAGRVLVYQMQDGAATGDPQVFAEGLERPYGIAFYPADDPQYVYVGTPSQVVRYAYTPGEPASGDPEVVTEVPGGGNHWTRDLAFSPDGATLFVSVGSASNVAEDMGAEPDGFVEGAVLGAAWGNEELRADVLAMAPDGSGLHVYAAGLRNCSGLTVQPATGDVWCVVNERDGLGDNLPPDYATHVEEGAFYGWPWYYIGGNEDPRRTGERPDLADQVMVPDVLFQAHSAPLGIDFYDADAFPTDYQGDAFVAMHGSWNRSLRTGYKVVRLQMDENGQATGVYEDFLTGFVTDDGRVWGRPVDVTVAPDGSLLVSDDGSGAIWRVAPAG